MELISALPPPNVPRVLGKLPVLHMPGVGACLPVLLFLLGCLRGGD